MQTTHFSPWPAVPHPCWHCHHFERIEAEAGCALCTLPNAARRRTLPADGCAGFEREVGADDVPEWVPPGVTVGPPSLVPR